MKKAIAILFLCLFSGIVSAQTLWGGFMIDIKNAAGDTVSTTNLQAVKTFVGAGGGGSVATDAIWDAKGDLAVGTGANTAVKLTVGTDGKQIYADADEATGLRWGPYTISPSQITSDQDDYAPTGWDEAQIVRLDAGNSIPAITSFAATFDGDRKRLTNIGSYPFYIPGEHPDGTAANRVTGLPKDAVVMPGKGVVIEYDGTASRWRVYDYADDNAMNNGRSYCPWSRADIHTEAAPRPAPSRISSPHLPSAQLARKKLRNDLEDDYDDGLFWLCSHVCGGVCFNPNAVRWITNI